MNTPHKPFAPRTEATKALEPYKSQFEKWYIRDGKTLTEVQELFRDYYELDIR